MTLTLSAVMQAHAGDPEKPGFFKRLFGTLSWEETVLTVDSPREAVYSVRQHIKYRTDINDKLTDPEQAWKNGYGDCEDIAHAIVRLCHENGLDAWVEVFYSPGSFNAHAVAMGRVDGQLWIGNDRLRKIDDIKDARAVIARSMRWNEETVSSKTWHELHIKYNVAGKPDPGNSSAKNPVQLASINP